MTEGLVSASPCLNCGAELVGAYCHQCGQRNQPRRLPLKALFHDVVHDIWHFDHKVLETVWLLLRKPGFLTREYLEGRRVRYVPPFRLYIFVSFLLFAAFAAVPLDGARKADGTSKAPRLVVGGTPGPATTQAQPTPWENDLQARAKKAAQDPQRFQRTFLSNLSKALFMLMPLFAGILLLFHAGRKSLFVEHLVLSLHHHTASFLAILALIGLAALPGSGWGVVPGCLLVLLPPLHLAAALRRLHGQGWFASLGKALVASVLYGLVVGAALLGLLYLSLPPA